MNIARFLKAVNQHRSIARTFVLKPKISFDCISFTCTHSALYLILDADLKINQSLLTAKSLLYCRVDPYSINTPC